MSTPGTPGRSAHRLAVATALCAVPLLLFGGSVTTLGAGMAVEGWLVAEGHFLLVFPVEKWFRDVPTFVEHTHRLFGALVGFAAIATVVAAWRARHPARWLAAISLAAVCAQGALGGFRVLENSESLAFVHGALAQAVFALLCVTAARLRTAPAGAPERERSGDAAGVHRMAWIATAVVFAQVASGAWYRHGLRPDPVPGVAERLHLHLLGALVAFGAVAALRSRVDAAGADPRAGRQLALLLGAQLALGALAWLGDRPEGVAPLEWACSVLHVLFGALLLARCATLAVLPRHGAATPVSALSRVGGTA